jgi:hypothetical protein
MKVLPWIIIVCMAIGILYLYNRKPETVIIDRDSIIRDSIYIVNDSIVEKIKYITIEHEKEVSDIMSNDDSTNMVLFSKYIDNYQRSTTNN